MPGWNSQFMGRKEFIFSDNFTNMNDRIDIDGYLFFKNYRDELFLMIADEDYDIVFDYIKEKEIKKIFIGFIGGNTGENLNFLKEITFFEKIIVFFKEKIDLTGLYHQKELKELYISEFDPLLDWNRFPDLEVLYLSDLEKPLGDLFLNKLKELRISHLKNKDLRFLENTAHVEQLKIVNSKNLTSLAGVGRLPLQVLDLMYLPKLSGLTDIEKLSSLEKLSFVNCPGVVNLEPLSALVNLKYLEITNCKEIASLDFLQNLNRLEKVYMEKTRVLDGKIPHYVTVFKG